MSSAGEVGALAMMVLGTILTIACVFIPYWKINDPEDTIRDNIFRHEGLWIKCQSLVTGNWDCDDFNRFFLGLPRELQAARAFSLLSIVCAVGGMIAMAVGLESIPCGKSEGGSKRSIRFVAAALSLIAGVMIVAAVSWYANDVRIDHERATDRRRLDSTESLNRFIFGACLFVGWVGGCMLVLAGLVAACTGFSGRSYEDSQPRYSYKPPMKAAMISQEYV